MCVCPEGYRKLGYSDDCEDIDECAADSRLCGQGRCVNTEGGYTCECPAGYEASPDGKECVDRRKGMCYKKVLFGGRCPRGSGVGGVTKVAL